MWGADSATVKDIQIFEKRSATRNNIETLIDAIKEIVLMNAATCAYAYIQ
jgi:hypothetical protein